MYLILVRRYNDIDHIVPIVWKMAHEGDGPLSILCTDPYLDIHADFRIRFLRDAFGINCGYLEETAPRTLRHHLLNLGIDLMPITRNRSNSGNRILGALVGRQNNCCSKQWAENFVETRRPRAIIVDWSKTDGTPAGKIIDVAKARGIPVVAVPHGVNYMTNDLRTRKAVATGIPGLWGDALRPMSHVIVQHRRHGEWLTRCGVEPQKILIMGSTRYCREWRSIYDKIIPPSPSTLSNLGQKLKVVYFDHVAEIRMNVAAIESSLLAISKLEFVELIIKPTTAGNKFSSPTLREFSMNGEHIHSNTLIDWADVVMGTTTSMLLEAFLREKPLLYPRYFHENDQLFDEMNACLAVDDQEGLICALEKLRKNPAALPYARENVEAFLTEVLYGGKNDRDVLGEYRQAIVAAAEGRLHQAADWEPIFET